MQLRDYQERMIGQARMLMRQGVKRILFQLATGGGKTAMSAHMIGGSAGRGMRSHFNVHRRELIDQTGDTFREVGIDHGYCAAGLPFNPFELVLICGVQTLIGKLATLRDRPPLMRVWDECHHMTARTWRELFDAFPDCFDIGLSATPERLDGSGLGDFFQAMICGPSTAELIQLGHLSGFRYFAPGKPDLVGVGSRGGDWNRSDLGGIMDEPKLVGDVVEHYLQLAPGEKGVVFAVNREHSRHLADAFKGNGIAAANIDGSMDAKERRRIVDAFRAGDIRIMANVDLFGEGFNVPDMVYCGLARPTKSLALFLQQCGRALRTYPGKGQAIIADHAGNAFTHGLPDDNRTWALEGRSKRKAGGAGTDATPIHQCPECYQITYSNTVVCPCGHRFAVKDRMPGWEEGQLFELQRVKGSKPKDQATLDKQAGLRACNNAASYIAFARKHGYKNPVGWASMQLEMRDRKKGGRFFALKRAAGRRK